MTRAGLHTRTHPEPVEGCWGCRALTVQFGSPQGSAMRRRDREFDADQQAYKRLRKDGLQPNSPQGAADVERAQLEQIEIDYKQRLKPEHKEQLKDIQSEVAMASFAQQPR